MNIKLVIVRPNCDIGQTVKVRPEVGGQPIKGGLRTISAGHILVDEKGIG